MENVKKKYAETQNFDFFFFWKAKRWIFFFLFQMFYGLLGNLAGLFECIINITTVTVYRYTLMHSGLSLYRQHLIGKI